MDNPSSFSLGMTQLDATVQDIPLGFVPTTFDEQDPDWAENRSKHRNDPVTMKKLKDKTASKSKKSTSKASKKKFDYSGRPRLPKGMKYRIDKVSPHSFHMGSLCNYAFREEMKEYFREDVLGAFRNTIFGVFLDLSWCNWIGKISKCLLMLEIQQDNKDELHVWVQGKILKVTMLEFAIITSLKCIGNIDDYMYTSSSKSALISRYFPDNKGAITRSKLIIRVHMGNFDNAEDALNLEILFFVHTFMFSQHKKAPISVVHFQIVEDGRYINFSWGKRNAILRILNWSVECIRPKYETFMSGMFTKHSDKNIQPTTDEVSRLDLSCSKNFEICDPTTYASTSDSGKLKRTTAELQQRVGTIVEEFVHHGSDLYREMQKNAVDKGEIGVSEIQHHHHREIGVSPQSHQHKSVPSSSKQHEGTSKSSLDGDEMKNHINKCMAELVTLISKILAEVVKALKNEENKQSQVRELQASKENAPAKRERKKSRILRLPYISKYGSGSKDSVDFDKEEKLKYTFDGCTINQDLTNELMIDYSQWIAVGLLKTHSAKKETDNHYRVNSSGLGYSQLKFIVAYPQSKNWFYFMSEQPTVELSTPQDYAESIVVAKNENSIANIIHGFCMPAGLPWEKKGCDNGFYDKTERTDWPSLEAYKGKITQQTGLVNEISFDVDYVQNFPQQASDSLDCGVFVCVYAEILSEGLQVHSCGFDVASQCARYASLLWHYGVEKTNEGYTSDNGDPPRPKKSVIEVIETSAIVTLE
ncbi:hypothetical protein BC332_22080 [Capsicum chinense]|nr:hypothetical protein BC332_22080 [Capsicum chinense]